MIKITFDARDIQEKIIRAVSEILDPKGFLNWYKDYLMKEIRHRFTSRSGPDGISWPKRHRAGTSSGALLRSIQGTVFRTRLTISTDKEYAWSYQKGVTIRPKKNPAGYLAIPATEQNKGISPRTYGNLTQVLQPRVPYGPRPVILKSDRKQWWNNVMYWYVRSVTIEEHPFFGFAAKDIRAAEDYIAEQFER